jgi:hypothetical protein
MLIIFINGALLGVRCDSRQPADRALLGDSAVLKSRRTTVKKGEKATATLFYLFSTALYFKKRQRHWHREGSDIQSTQVSLSVMGLA